jgi:hypothetical protein
MENKFIVEDELLVSIPNISGEVAYDFKCYDTYADGTLSAFNEEEVLATAPKQIRMVYPSLAEIKADEERANYVLEYRGLYDLSVEDIHYGDICISLGELENFS